MELLLSVLLIILVVCVVFMIVAYNRLVVLRNRCKNAWAQIEVQLTRRYDLIPNLINTVKGYASHEANTLQAVTEARMQAQQANPDDVTTRIASENRLSGALRSLFAVAENYPDLKASENFQDLQHQLKDTEDTLSYARQSYNDCVTMYDNAREQFPVNIVAHLFSSAFPSRPLYKAPAGDRENVRVSF